MTLSKKEKQELEAQREEKIVSQADALAKIIDKHKNNPTELHNTLSQNLKSYKADAIELALQRMKTYKLPKETTMVVEKLWHSRRIGEVKINRGLIGVGAKPGGITEGGLHRKKPKNEQDKNKLKQEKTVLLKNGGKDGGYQGEEVCEYLGTNLGTSIMGGRLSPKFRIHKKVQENKEYVASTFIADFKTADDGANMSKAKGFARFFTRQFAIANYDIHGGNLGTTTLPNGETYWTAIDDGRALCYKYLDVNQFKKFALSIFRNVYSKKMFHGKEFACELNTAANELDPEILRHIIKESMKNLKAAYGDDFLKHPHIKEQFKDRMGLTGKLTEQMIEDKIIENIEARKIQLKEMAKLEAKRVIKKATLENDTATLKYMNEHMPESISSFIEDAIKSKDIATLKYMNEHMPESISSFIKDSITSKGIPILKDTVDIKNVDPSPLKLAIDNDKEIAILMVKAGFTLREDEIKPALKGDKNNESDRLTKITKSQSIKQRLLHGNALTKNDQLRISIIGLAAAADKGAVDLSKKPSPLHLAIQTNQTDLALKLVNHGYKLKKSEIADYAAKNQEIKLGFLEKKLGYYSKKRVENLGKAIAEKLKASQETQPQAAIANISASGFKRWGASTKIRN